MARATLAKLLLSLVTVALIVAASLAVTSRKNSALAGPNLILISLDTLRADRLGTYKYSRPTSPFLDAWAENAAVFDNAVAAAPWTLPSHVSMFTGLYPSSHGVNKAKKRSIGNVMEFLPETLQQRGYQTIAITAGGYVAERYGFARGFDSFVQNKGEQVSEARGFPYTIKMAREKLSARDKQRPFFMFLHTYAVHCPYSPPEPYLSMFTSTNSETIETDTCRRFNGNPNLTAGNAQYLSDRYDGSVRYLDLHLEKFFAGLKEDNLIDNTVIIVTSDHGEEFFEHGRIGHKKSLYKELLMIPLIVSGPGIKAQRIAEAVNHVDIFPTVLDLLGLPASKQPEGHSLWALLHGEQEKFSRPPYQFSELEHGARLRSLLDPTASQFILDLKTNSPELFDLSADPVGRRNIAPSSPDRIAEWRGILDRITKGMYERPAGALDPATTEQLEQLKTLGYL